MVGQQKILMVIKYKAQYNIFKNRSSLRLLKHKKNGTTIFYAKNARFLKDTIVKENAGG